MLADIHKHKSDYSLLAFLAALYLAVVVKVQTTPLYLVVATAIFAGCYLIWGIVHHLKTRSFTLKVMLEYFLVAALAVVIVATLLI